MRASSAGLNFSVDDVLKPVGGAFAFRQQLVSSQIDFEFRD